MEKLLNPREVADLLGIKVSTIYAWKYKKKIPWLKIGSNLRFSPSTLKNWIREKG